MFHKRAHFALLCISSLALLMPSMPALGVSGHGEHSNRSDDDEGQCGGDSNDHTPPTLSCASNTSVECGESTHPANTGYAIVTDDPDARLTWSDSVQTQLCGVGLAPLVDSRVDRIITRTWRARDRSGNSSTCTQEIRVNKLHMPMDILPGDCANVFELDCQPLPITVLGTDAIPVGQIRLNSVRVSVPGQCELGGVKPRGLYCGDVATQGNCQIAPDGRVDLTFFFNKAQLAERFGFASGTSVRLVISGELCSGCEFSTSPVDTLYIP